MLPSPKSHEYEKPGSPPDGTAWLQTPTSVITIYPHVYTRTLRYDGLVEVLGANNEDVVATWQFERGVPARVRGPELNARTGEIAIEELHIAHEGLRLV